MHVLIHLSQSTPGTFLTWGVFGIQLGNLIVIISMFVLSGLALVVPFPGGQRTSARRTSAEPTSEQPARGSRTND